MMAINLVHKDSDVISISGDALSLIAKINHMNRKKLISAIMSIGGFYDLTMTDGDLRELLFNLAFDNRDKLEQVTTESVKILGTRYQIRERPRSEKHYPSRIIFDEVPLDVVKTEFDELPTGGKYEYELVSVTETLIVRK